MIFAWIFFVDHDATTERADGSCVVVEWSVEVFPCGDVGVECRLAKKIERKFRLWEEEIP